MNEAEKVTEYLKQSGLLANWQQVTVAMKALGHAVATVRYAESDPRQWHVVSKDGFTNEALWNVYEVKLPPDSPADHFADAGKMVETRWIPVSERLPEHDSRVLVAAKQPDGQLVVKELLFVDWSDPPEPPRPEWSGDRGHERNVTHWMPLPEPPEVK